MIGAYLFDIKLNLIDSISPDVMFENTQTLELGGQINGTIRFKYKESSEEAEYFGVKEDNNFWLYKIIFACIKSETRKTNQEYLNLMEFIFFSMI